MNCRNLVELVTDYLDGALAEEERAAIDAHLAECEDCAKFLEQMRVTIRVTGTLEEEAIPDRLREPLLRAFRSWHATT